MKKPITLHIPDYYDQKYIDGNCLKFSKTKPILEEDNTKSIFLASIEKIDDYQCNIKEIPEEYLTRANKFFKQDRAENGELPIKVGDKRFIPIIGMIRRVILEFTGLLFQKNMRFN